MGKNNAQFLNWDNIKAIKQANRAGTSIKKLSKQYKIGVVTTANAVKATSLAHFKQLQAERSAKETASKKQRREDAKSNAKVTDAAAKELRKRLTTPYTPEQTRAFIDALLAHVDDLEDRVTTLTQLLITSDDNVVSRIYKLEGKKNILRRFLDKF